MESPAAHAPYPHFVDPPPLPRWRRVLTPVAGFLAGVGGGVAAAHLAFSASGPLHGLGGIGLGAALATFALGLWLHVILHEAGHALAGRAAGMRVVALGIGRWRFERGGDGWRAWRGGSLAGIGGFAALVPGRERGGGAPAQAMYLLGGPAANLATGGAAIALAIAFATTLPAWIAGALLGLGASGLLLGAINLLPFRTHGWRSDGMGLADLLLGRPDARLLQRAQAAMALSAAGIRPRDWPLDVVPDEAAITGASTTAATMVRQLRLSRAIDAGDAAAAADAARALAVGAADMPVAFRGQVALSMAAWAACCSHDDRLLDAWRALCTGAILDVTALLHWIDGERARRRGDDAGARRELAGARHPRAAAGCRQRQGVGRSPRHARAGAAWRAGDIVHRGIGGGPSDNVKDA
ncbi:hypothetical protein CO641_10695 [Lysobacteraceae bacterium NML91-0213]|nr:hypothetical protein CO641_10695 [Xanthomonadaceae bacterium NML91-0213]